MFKETLFKWLFFLLFAVRGKARPIDRLINESLHFFPHLWPIFVFTLHLRTCQYMGQVVSISRYNALLASISHCSPKVEYPRDRILITPSSTRDPLSHYVRGLNLRAPLSWISSDIPLRKVRFEGQKKARIYGWNFAYRRIARGPKVEEKRESRCSMATSRANKETRVVGYVVFRERCRWLSKSWTRFLITLRKTRVNKFVPGK